jgi:hypothetical protein
MGVSTVWIHGDDKRGCAQAHKCPKCGAQEWEKWLVEVGKLPAHQAHGHAEVLTISAYQIVGLAFVIAGLLIVIYAGMVWYRDNGEEFIKRVAAKIPKK